MGATPAKLTMSGWTTPRVIPAATPASMALPPAASTRAPACAARGWPAAIIHRRPITCAMVDPSVVAARWLCAESRLMRRILSRASRGIWGGAPGHGQPLVGARLGDRIPPMPAHPPLIGVSASITVDKHPERAYVNSTYLHAVQQAGGVPVLLPPQLSGASLDRLARGLDGLLLTGGGDVDPTLFGEPPHTSLYDVAPARDAVETTVLRMALDRRLPILAICRGVQVLN